MWYVNYCIIVGSYLASSLVCFILDMKFPIGKGYKIKDDMSRSDYIKLYRKFTPLSLFNICISIIPFIYITDTYYLSKLPFYPDTDSILKGSLICLYELIFILVDTDIIFYIAHRLLHCHPIIYKAIHNTHHKILHPIGIGAVYANPIDFYIGNIIPIFLGAYFFASNVLVYRIWMLIAIISSVIISHSGIIGISEEHDFHHTIGKYNYGISVFMDKLFGTYHNPKMNFYYGKYINKNYNNDDNNDNNDNNNDRITKFKNKN